MHCILEWIKQEAAKGQCPMCRQRAPGKGRIAESSTAKADARAYCPSEHPAMTSRDPQQPSLSASPRPGSASPPQKQQPPSAQAETQPVGEHLHDDDDDDDDDDNEAAGAGEPEHTLPPLFTLIHNATSKTTHHPHVHYIFADDDPDILTRALSAADPASADSEPGRSVLVDLEKGADGSWTVANAASLSSDWAVIEGVDGVEGGLELSEEGSGAKTDVKEDYNALIEEFERQMVVMRRVVESGQSKKKPTDTDDRLTGLEEADEKAESGTKVGD
ncbi:unnamed protein product [Parascedosporium putredinis]|uniref:Anaphase-promoting complex subunit 11 RING-H2 finger domain-containing protein n=1 Tax=Parascedosporium putredinis TaxID=1442378 RepID=A0A9P1MEX4_9PEZI|nr:unnamed protein product [Parascedosporium putredinis]CAI8002308.1 unnamed protein product [Parascedosporium putredinis]